MSVQLLRKLSRTVVYSDMRLPWDISGLFHDCGLGIYVLSEQKDLGVRENALKSVICRNIIALVMGHATQM